MKLRIQGNVLRIRLTQTEVGRLHDGGPVECSLRFPSGGSLGYLVATSPEVTEISVDYGGDSIRIVLPSSIARTWAESNQVTIEGFLAPDFQVLIEKGF
jgi:hypothetical protein